MYINVFTYKAEDVFDLMNSFKDLRNFNLNFPSRHKTQKGCLLCFELQIYVCIFARLIGKYQYIGKYQFKGRHFSLSFIITNKAYMDQMC